MTKNTAQLVGLGLMALLAALGACTGSIASGEGDDATPAGVQAGRGGSAARGTGGTTAAGTGGSVGAAGEKPVPTTRFPRLSHAQWENTTRDLLRLAQRPALAPKFTSDPPGGDFDNNTARMMVTPGLWGDYQTAAETLAHDVAADPAKLARLLPAGIPASGDARARAFLSDFGRRAYRRPLATAEVDELLALFKQGPALIGGDAFASGAELSITAILQAPDFLYRVESGTKAGPDGLVALGPYERASRLSYLLWNTMPDEALFTAAAAGELADPAGVDKWAARMLADPRADETLASFHRQLFHTDAYKNIYKDPKKFPQFSAALPPLLASENALFVREVVVTRKGGLRDLLTAPFSFVNDKLAPFYGLTGTFGSELTRVDLDPARRAGLFTQLGFLAANATALDPDPIHRGVYINLHTLCADLPPPPANVPPLPADSGNKTNRQRVDAHTGPGTCGAGCHSTLINPIGFAFENYDALGVWRDNDKGMPVDARASYPMNDGTITYNGAVELAQTIAKNEQTHACYARNWIAFAYGLDVAAADEGLTARLAAQSRDGGSVLQMLGALTQAKSFLNRTVEGPQ